MYRLSCHEVNRNSCAIAASDETHAEIAEYKSLALEKGFGTSGGTASAGYF